MILPRVLPTVFPFYPMRRLPTLPSRDPRPLSPRPAPSSTRTTTTNRPSTREPTDRDERTPAAMPVASAKSRYACPVPVSGRALTSDQCDASDSASCTECSNRKVRCQFTKETNRRMSSIKSVLLIVCWSSTSNIPQASSRSGEAAAVHQATTGPAAIGAGEAGERRGHRAGSCPPNASEPTGHWLPAPMRQSSRRAGSVRRPFPFTELWKRDLESADSLSPAGRQVARD